MYIASETVGIELETLKMISRTELLDSALHAPQATFDGIDLYESFHLKAAVLCRSVALNHPLLDGNKRLSWQLLDFFCESNGFVLRATTEDAVEIILRLAAGDVQLEELTEWIKSHTTLAEG